MLIHLSGNKGFCHTSPLVAKSVGILRKNVHARQLLTINGIPSLSLLPLTYLSLTYRNLFPFRSGVREPQHHLHLQWSGDELQRWCHCCLRQPDISRQRRGGPGRRLWEPRPGRGQRDHPVFPELPEVTRGLCFPQHLARRDTASPGSDGEAATAQVKSNRWLTKFDSAMVISISLTSHSCPDKS